MLHILFNCKPHHILMDLLFVSVITLLVYFSTFAQFYITFIQTFYDFYLLNF